MSTESNSGKLLVFEFFRNERVGQCLAAIIVRLRKDFYSICQCTKIFHDNARNTSGDEAHWCDVIVPTNFYASRDHAKIVNPGKIAYLNFVRIVNTRLVADLYLLAKTLETQLLKFFVG
ncbi:hypothetical protein D3C76_990810 [compost metagenome]